MCSLRFSTMDSINRNSMKPVLYGSLLIMLLSTVAVSLPYAARGRRAPVIFAPNQPHGDRCVRGEIYDQCYICGKLMDNQKVFTSCCMASSDIVEFCYQLLS